MVKILKRGVHCKLVKENKLQARSDKTVMVEGVPLKEAMFS